MSDLVLSLTVTLTEKNYACFGEEWLKHAKKLFEAVEVEKLF